MRQTLVLRRLWKGLGDFTTHKRSTLQHLPQTETIICKSLYRWSTSRVSKDLWEGTHGTASQSHHHHQKCMASMASKKNKFFVVSHAAISLIHVCLPCGNLQIEARLKELKNFAAKVFALYLICRKKFFALYNVK